MLGCSCSNGETESTRFISALFGGVKPGIYFYIWSMPGKKTVCYKTTEDGEEVVSAGSYAQRIGGKSDVYIGCGLSDRVIEAGERDKKERVAGITSLWIDLDIGKPNTPRTLQEAQAAIDAMPVKPTMIVNSGNGLHLWYCFKEPWIFDTAEERAQAAALVKAWQELMRHHMRRIGGWELDFTADLARILRVPGTKNFKDKKNPKPVTILDHDDARRFNPDELADLCDEHMPQEAAPLLADVAPQDVPTAEPEPAGELALDPMEVLRRIKEMNEGEPDLRNAWDNKRGNGDRSANIQSFISQLVYANPDMSTAFLRGAIALFYDIHGDTKEKRAKGRRVDFQNLTIAKARDFASRQHKEREASKVVDDYAEQSRCAVMQSGGESVKEIAKSNAPKLTAALTDQFGFQVHGVRRYLGEPVTFELATNVGAVDLGPPEAFASQARFRSRVMGITGRVIPTLPRKRWESVLQAMLDIAEDVQLAEESTSVGLMRSIIRDHVAGATNDAEGAMADDNPWRSGLRDQPFRIDGVTYLRLAGLREHIRQGRYDIGDREIGKLLAQAGCVPAKPHVVGDDGKRTTRSAYRVPDDLARQG